MSSIGKKLLTGVTGLAACGFLVGHLIGNLLIIVGPDALNHYTHFLETLAHGFFLPVAEAGLIVLFVLHAYAGVVVWLDKRKARPIGNTKVGNAGGPSQKTLASKTMIYTGVLLLVFLVWHVWTIRLGENIEQGYVTMIDGHEARDLYRLVIEIFQSEVVVGIYVVMMVLLGFHLWHGFWSAFQSLGANNPKYMPIITTLGVVFAIVMAVGFLMLPIYIYVFLDSGGASAAASLAGGAP
jgi:succinate dehydrogenase / fumarate reductase cytochrome b subunit